MTEHTEPAALRDRVLQYILQTDYVTFAELANHFGDQFRSGDYAICKGQNIILWAGMTEEASTAVQDLLDTGAIEPHPASIFTYAADGYCSKLPLVKQLRQYKTPHWLPVALRPPGRATAARKKDRR